MMRRIATTLLSFVIALFLATPLLAQQEGDYRTRDSGDWSNPQIWEQFNGNAWVAVGTSPTGAEVITVVSTEERTDSVFVDVETSITGHLINQGIVDTEGQLTISDGGIYEHARDAGNMPLATWAEGSTLLMTGVEATAPEDRNQNYYNITFNTPDLLANLNMDLDDITIGGDIRVLNTGLARWYLTSVLPNDTSVVTIEGDVIVEDGAFSVQGTSNAQTTFIVHHYGNIDVTGGNFSISRGSQGLGTTTWYLYEGYFSMTNATTQSSTVTPQGARFVFAKEGTQTFTIADMEEIVALPLEVSSGTTVDMGASRLSGSGHFLLSEGGTIATALPGGVAEIFADENYVGEVMLEDNSGYIFNGTEAQVTSELMPTVVSDLTINNPAGVTLSQETTINGTLRLVAGVFDNAIPFTLGPDAELVIEGGSLAVPVANESESELPRTFVVHQNFPNPFNPSTVIRYGLPAASEVTIRVYNLLGQEVMTSFEGRKPAGEHAFVLDAGTLSSGMYIYRVESAGQSGSTSISKQMVVIK